MKTIIIDGIEYNLTPKVLFKKGDFVVIQETTYQITKVENLNVTLSLNGRECIFDIDVLKNAHLWTIADAKDGDVLSNGKMIVIFKHFEEPSYRQHIVAYIGLDTNGDIQITDDTWNFGIDKVKPATKEQRDLLFAKMHGEGYEWDAEKKEPKKIKQKPWSEEDEDILKSIIATCELAEQDRDSSPAKHLLKKQTNWLKFLKYRVQLQPKPAWSEEDERNASYICAALDCYYRLREDRNNTNGQEDLDKARNWLYNKLKSLNPHNRWEPSDEQMDALDSTLQYSQVSHNSFEHLNSLFNDLKKLREK